MNDVTLHLGDCVAYMRGMATGSVDCVVTDPPYGVGKAEWDVVFPIEWIAEAWRLTPRMLVMPGNSALLDAGNAIGKYRDCIVMHARNGMTLSKIAFGNWFPVLACGDWQWEARPNVLPFNVITTEHIDHPSPKPLPAMVRLIRTYTNPGDLIFDPFMGSGTTGVACIQTGRRFVGCEISPEYFKVAQRRIADAQARPPLIPHADLTPPSQAEMFTTGGTT